MDWYRDVFDIVFPDVDTEAVNGLWKEHLKEPEKKSRARKDTDAVEELSGEALADM